jgi:dTDP-glucose pyrophosphorylase
MSAGHYTRHLILRDKTVKDALALLDQLAADAILFVVDENNKLVGSLTDGDVRRGLLRGLSIHDNVTAFIQPNPKYIRKGEYSIEQIIRFREGFFKIIPVIDGDGTITNVINFRFLKSYLPVDAVIMAGGRGERLKPLTNDTPKPMLKIGDKPILEHNIDRLISFGIDDFWISVRYLGDQIEKYFGDGKQKNVSIEYVHEDEPLGTIGAVKQISSLRHDTVLLTNSDILTTIDYEDFYLQFLKSGADFSVATIPYDVNVPYAVLETVNGHVVSFREKPTYTYYSNGGIYLMKRHVVDQIPANTFFNATDLMEVLIKSKVKVFSYPLRGYWLDVGKPEDYRKAQDDISNLKL